MLNEIKNDILRKQEKFYFDKRNEHYCKVRDYYDAHMFDEAYEELNKVYEYDRKWSKVTLELIGADA